MLHTVLPYSWYVPDTTRRVQRHLDDNPFPCSVSANIPNYKYTLRRSRRPAAELGLVAGQNGLMYIS